MKALLWPFLMMLVAFPLQAGAEVEKQAAFFEALYDVPIMPGLQELKDQAMLFDKPDGRIASVVAASKTLPKAEVARFYHDSLPQLGWIKTSENQYVRGSDLLYFEVVAKPPLTIVHFTLSPRKGAAP